MGRRTTAALAALALAAGAAGSAPNQALAQAPTERAWVQVVQTGRELRATTASGACPTAQVDGTARPMRLRAVADAAFPTICALSLEPSARTVSVESVQIALPAAIPHRIVVLGDTGCRIKGKKVQACDDPAAWPFPEVAKLAAARHPDLILHVGDYLYRESPCPAADITHCAGTPHGDAWGAWSADFFEPVAPLLDAAPWVFVRGNHESCARAALGWFRLLDAAPQPPVCPDQRSVPFSVDLGGVSLVVLDSADPEDFEVKNDKAFRADFEAGMKLAPKGPVWVVTHRPVWGVTQAPAKLGPVGPVTLEVGLNRSEQAALHGEDLKRVDLVVAGHIHQFESLDFGPARPPQLIVGTGGDVAEDGASPKIERKGYELDGLEAQLLKFARFGYMVLDRTEGGWNGAFYDAQDRLTATCRIRDRSLACETTTK